MNLWTLNYNLPAKKVEFVAFAIPQVKQNWWAQFKQTYKWKCQNQFRWKALKNSAWQKYRVSFHFVCVCNVYPEKICARSTSLSFYLVFCVICIKLKMHISNDFSEIISLCLTMDSVRDVDYNSVCSCNKFSFRFFFLSPSLREQ